MNIIAYLNTSDGIGSSIEAFEKYNDEKEESEEESLDQEEGEEKGEDQEIVEELISSSTNPQHLKKLFEKWQKDNTVNKKPSIPHVVFAFNKKEKKLSNNNMTDIIKEFFSQMEINFKWDGAYKAVRHNDEDHQHFHLLIVNQGIEDILKNRFKIKSVRDNIIKKFKLKANDVIIQDLVDNHPNDCLDEKKLNSLIENWDIVDFDTYQEIISGVQKKFLDKGLKQYEVIAKFKPPEKYNIRFEIQRLRYALKQDVFHVVKELLEKNKDEIRSYKSLNILLKSKRIKIQLSKKAKGGLYFASLESKTDKKGIKSIGYNYYYRKNKKYVLRIDGNQNEFSFDRKFFDQLIEENIKKNKKTKPRKIRRKDENINLNEKKNKKGPKR